MERTEQAMARAVVDRRPVGGQRLAMTYDEWRAWDADAEFKSEWVNGEAIVFMSTTVVHARIVRFLLLLLAPFVELKALGEVLAETIEMRFPDRSRVPDILFIARNHADRVTALRVVGGADLVVEVVSDDSVERDNDDKFREYAEAGVEEYWIVDPRPGRQQANFYGLSDGRFEEIPVDRDGRYRSRVVPGFWFRPAWLWQDPLPNALACLAAIAPEATRAALAEADAEIAG